MDVGIIKSVSGRGQIINRLVSAADKWFSYLQCRAPPRWPPCRQGGWGSRARSCPTCPGRPCGDQSRPPQSSTRAENKKIIIFSEKLLGFS